MYEIYPQSFLDTNGDGVGDFRGVISKLDYLQWLGINAIWFNPCFASPFVDAGYDVSDYLQVAPRYGTNADLEELMREAAARDIRVILDLVAGHTSVEHEWFVHESNLPGPDPDGDRYIWAEDITHSSAQTGVLDSPHWVPSPGKRPGYYMKNFYDEQPALNYGYSKLDPLEPWRDLVSDRGPQRNLASLKETMSFWLERGAAGFRVDMAFSMVKDDPGWVETIKLWHDLRQWIDTEYPDAIFVPEGVEPVEAKQASFHGDFFLVIGYEHGSLFHNHGAGNFPHRVFSPCYFDAAGEGDTAFFEGEWKKVRRARPGRPIIMGTADHDFSRMACGERTAEQLGVAFAMLFSWGNVPAVYYGDEVGMRYLTGMPNKEGAVCWPGFYNRAGCRTPMQWDSSANAGFSTAASADLYLPIDPDPNRPNVASQIDDPHSHLHLVRELIALYKATPALRTGTDAEVLHRGYPWVYLRGGTHLVVLNPKGQALKLTLHRPYNGKSLINRGVELADGDLSVAAFGFAIIELDKES